MKSLITHPNFDYLWQKICANHPQDIEQVIVNFSSFPDGWPNLHIDDVKNKIEHKEVTYIWDFSRPEYFFSNYAMLRWIIDYYAQKVRVIVPYFPVGTMERISKKWEIATASYFADMLSHLPHGRAGKTSIHTFDIHALSERFLFNSFQVNAELHSAMNLLEAEKDVVIAFPDSWAYKRFENSFPGHEKIICDKIRQWEERVVTIKEWDPQWKNVIIIDDLIQTWGTIKEASILLKDRWAKSVSAFATHWVFPGDAHIKLAPYLDRLIVTDSIPDNHIKAKQVANMSVLSISKSVEKIIFHD